MAKKVTKNRKQAEQAAAKRRHLRIMAGIIMVAAAAGLACGGLVWYQHDQKAQQQAPDSADMPMCCNPIIPQSLRRTVRR